MLSAATSEICHSDSNMAIYFGLMHVHVQTAMVYEVQLHSFILMWFCECLDLRKWGCTMLFILVLIFTSVLICESLCCCFQSLRTVVSSVCVFV